MSSTTPLLPLELPPYSLQSLVTSVFAPPPQPTSPTKPVGPGSPSNPLGRFGQLVSDAANSVAGSEGAAAKAGVIKAVEASQERVWVGGNDGRIRIYGAGEGTLLESGSASGRSTPSSTGRIPRLSELDLVQDVAVTHNRKAIDRIGLLERLDKAIILSEGILTFHALPALTPLPVHVYPSLKGVTAFSLDEDELLGGGSPRMMHICVIRRRTIQILRITNEGVTTIREHPLRGGAFIAVLRRRYVCIADAENYSIIDIEDTRLMPLLPISQSPNTESLPQSTVAGSSAPAGGLDPRQRPAIVCIAPNEFLIASHTGNTTLGVFVTETGEPCRGTLEWSSNLRSMCVEPPYIIALLHNNTIEVHSYETQEIVQVIPLPISTSPKSLQPRSLARTWPGFDVGGSTGSNKMQSTSVSLLPRADDEQPRTPSRRSISHSASPSISKDARTLAKTLVVGKNGLYALVPLTFVAQAEALIAKDRLQDALQLAGQIESAGSDAHINPELAYVFIRAAFLSLHSTLFQDAFALFLRSGCDPRLVVRMFADLRDPLISSHDEIVIPDGLEFEVSPGLTIDGYIMASLTRNYSPHLKPDVESASSTSQLRSILATTARDCARDYLSKWRLARRNGGMNLGGEGDSRKIDMVVDTALVRLLAEEDQTEELLRLLSGPNDCVVQEATPTLLEFHHYSLLASIYLKAGDSRRTLDIWTKLVEGEYIEEAFVDGVQKIFELLSSSKDEILVEKFGLWLIVRERAMGLKLFCDPRQTLHFDTRDLFVKIRQADPDAADLFLESVVLSRRDTDSRLHADLVKRYIDRLGELLADPATKSHLRDQESSYAEVRSRSPLSPPSFLHFLVSRYDSASPHVNFDRVRLKTILFLATSVNYDAAGTKKELEELEMKGLRGLTLERAIVYGKLQLDRQALSLLLHSLRDLTSSETYCHQSGDPLLSSDLFATASLLNLSMPTKSRTKPGAPQGGKTERKASLARLLVEMFLSKRVGEENADAADEAGVNEKQRQVARILETQAIHLDCLEVLPLLPADWSLDLFSSFFARSLRRSLHSRQEAALFKSLSLCQNSEVSERLGALQASMGGTLAERGEGGGDEVILEPEVIELPVKEKEKIILL